MQKAYKLEGVSILKLIYNQNCHTFASVTLAKNIRDPCLSANARYELETILHYRVEHAEAVHT